MRSNGREARPQSAINVTPLVDVCLVLLIIFMVVAPMLGRQAELKLPEAARPAQLPEGRVVIAMRQDGTTWYRQSWLPPRELSAKLREIHDRSGAKELVLLADERLSFADVKRTLRLAEAAGFPGVSLAAQRRRGEAP